MTLAKAIEKRANLLKRAQDIEKWRNEQYVSNGMHWYEVKKAIDDIIGVIYEEYYALNEKITLAIEGMEIE